MFASVLRAFGAFLLAFMLLAAGPAALAQVKTENVTAEIVSSRAKVAPGESFTVALRLVVKPEWHTYWRNSGDSGAPTILVWNEAPGWSFGPLQWPVPKVYHTPIGDGETLTTFIHEGETLYPVRISAPADAKPGPMILKAEAEWTVCSADTCLLETGAFDVPIEIAAAGADDPQWAGPIAAAAAAIPQALAGVEARISGKGDQKGVLTIAGAPVAQNGISRAYFFPYDSLALSHPAAQKAATGPRGLSLELVAGQGGPLGKGELAGVVAFEHNGEIRGVEINAQPGAALAGAGGGPVLANFDAGAAGAETSSPSAAALTLPLAILLAFVGGLILNVMPCVLPVLSLKALALANDHHSSRHGFVFLAGVMATFLVLAGGLIALQQAGAAVGWGFQLQEPLFVGGLALLFFVIGLNLLGVFEFGASLQNVGGELAAQPGDGGAFFTGMLAVLAATPCTAPFMASALGFAAAQPPIVSLAVFASLGLGFAAPMTIISVVPALRKRLPKPGAWMEKLKQFFAFPMFGTAVWLAWVTAGVAGADGLLVLLSIATAIAFSIWALTQLRSQAWKVASAAVAALLAGAVFYVTRPASVALTAEDWSPARVAELQAAGTPVFVNFTADWCVTCKINERSSLSSPDVAAAFAEAGIVYLKADWTARDAAIASELAKHGRNGVPLYLLYTEAGQPPRILPQLLTPDIVIDAIEETGSKTVAQTQTAG